MRAVVFLLALAVMLAACGYKGPLYIPKPGPEAQQPATDEKSRPKTAPVQ